MLNIANKNRLGKVLGLRKFTWDSTFVDVLGSRDAIKIKPKSNTGNGWDWECTLMREARYVLARVSAKSFR